MGILQHKGKIAQILIAAVFYVAAIIINSVNPGGVMGTFWIALLIFLVPYLIAGYSTIIEAVRGILHGNLLDENFLMAVASIAALCIGEFPEAVAVMLFYCVGEFFEDYAVDRSRRSISEMMDIQAEIAYVERNGAIEEVPPEEVAVGETIHVYPGERVPVDGVVIEGSGQVDASALTGESAPVFLEVGDDILSGSINTSTLLHVRTTALYEDSTVAKILDMVENARARKAKVENFITRFAHIYTPVVVIAAVLVAIIPPLFLGITDGQVWSAWIYRACIFLVISCPCALVISVPL
ncbi:MAG: HAD-IC family P-type ATPase, partial [Coriobacteriaceae bacterium]|nr:HAD-IC family P-type ATPase [Coriobacteriaceae bacterium]